MPQLFSPRADERFRTGLFLALALLLCGPALLLGWARGPSATGQDRPLEQPVAFSHPVHARALRIDCLYCHGGAVRGASAGVPPTRACVGCHDAQWLASPEFAPVRTSLSEHTPIAWRRVTSVPQFVFFDHAVHTSKGIGCESCHGRVDRMERVYQAEPMTMGWCLECHRAPARHVRPVEQVTTMGWEPPADTARQAALARQYHVRSITTCTACHR
jgi:hypothetical protein